MGANIDSIFGTEERQMDGGLLHRKGRTDDTLAGDPQVGPQPHGGMLGDVSPSGSLQEYLSL